jgi:hypothetical protein
VNDSNQLVVLARNLNQSVVDWSYSPTNGDQLGAFSLINGYLYFGGSSGNYYVKIASGVGGTNTNTLANAVIPTAGILVGSNVWFTNGNILYSKPQGAGGPPQVILYNGYGDISPLSAYGESILFGDTDGNIITYNTNTGDINNIYYIFGENLANYIPVAEGGYMFTVRSDMYLRDLTGNFGGGVVAVGNPDQILTPPAYVGNSTYVVGSTDANIYWVRRSIVEGNLYGTVIGTNATAGGINQSIAVQDGLAFVCTTTTAIYAFDTATRTQKWLNNQTPIATCPPVAYNDSVYIGTADGIFILDAQTGTLRTKMPISGIKYLVVDSATGGVYATRVSGTTGEILKLGTLPYSIRTLA